MVLCTELDLRWGFCRQYLSHTNWSGRSNFFFFSLRTFIFSLGSLLLRRNEPMKSYNGWPAMQKMCQWIDLFSWKRTLKFKIFNTQTKKKSVVSVWIMGIKKSNFNYLCRQPSIKKRCFMTLGGGLRLTKFFSSLYNTPVHRLVKLPVFCIWVMRHAPYSLISSNMKDKMNTSHIAFILNINSATAHAFYSYHCSCSYGTTRVTKWLLSTKHKGPILRIFRTIRAMPPCFPAFRGKGIWKLVKAIIESKSRRAMLRQHIQR